MLEKVKEAPGATVIGAVAGAIATMAVAFFTHWGAAYNFERNVTVEAVKGAKSAEDMKARLDQLCARKFMTGERCQSSAPKISQKS
jgi:hypothetical protein